MISGLLTTTFQELNVCTLCLKQSKTYLKKEGEKCSECHYGTSGLLDMFPLYIPDYLAGDIEEKNKEIRIKREFLHATKT